MHTDKSLVYTGLIWRRTREEDDGEEENSSKRLKRETEEFGYSDHGSYCSSSDRGVDDEDILYGDAGADKDVDLHVEEDPGRGR